MKLSFDHDTNQTRTVGMPLQKNLFDSFDEIDPFTQMASNPAKLERCVKHVKAKGGVDNAWAVCNASLNKKHG
jgi:hypothetical protein